MKMYDMAGALVIRKSLENRENSLSVVSLPAGVFQCIITDEAGIALTRKLVTKL